MTVASTAAVELTVPGIKGITSILGDDARLLEHQCKTIPKDSLLLPGPDYVDRAYGLSDRSPRVLGALQSMLNTGRLGGTGYVSILPVDQGIEHSAGASFAPNPLYFDSENIVKLAIEGGCNAVASTLGVLGSVSRKYAHKIPFILKFNHNEFISYPNTYDQIRFGSVKQAFNMGAAAVGATVYFGSEESKRQIQETTLMFQQAHELGLFTVLWCYLRNPAFKTKEVDYHLAADLTGQANHLGVTIEADIIKQKLPENNGGYNALKFGKTSPLVYEKLTTDHPIDLCRYQVANCYMGRIGLINSGGASSGESDLAEAVKKSAKAQPIEVKDEVQKQILEFITGRLKVVLNDLGFKYDVIDAVLAAQSNNPAGTVRAVKQLQAWTERDDWSSILDGFARCVRITRDQKTKFEVREKLFVEEAEKGLYEAVQSLPVAVEGDVDACLKNVATLIPSITVFFEKILVMAEDQAVKENRLGLLQKIASLTNGVADLSKLEGF
jgi:class I fructose-bisphosphate aldolase